MSDKTEFVGDDEEGLPPPPSKQWVKVRGSRAWRPKDADEVLEGTYAGILHKTTAYGPGTFHQVRTKEGTLYVTGVMADDLFNSVQLDIGEQVRVIFKGWKQLSEDREMKVFELYVQRMRHGG